MKPDVIDQLFRKYYNEALLYTLSLCRHRQLAEDIVSTAFFKALETSDEHILRFKPWLLAVCRNEYFTWCRRHRRDADGEPGENELRDEEELASRLILQEEYQALYSAIRTLPQAQREAVVSFYFSSLSVGETARVMGRSEGNVKVLLFRARAALKDKLEGML